MNRLRRRLRFRRIRVLVPSPEAEELMAHYRDQIDREHKWVHRLEDRIAELTEAAGPLARLPYPVSTDERTQWHGHQARLRDALSRAENGHS